MSYRLLGCEHPLEEKIICAPCATELLTKMMEKADERERLRMENERLKGELESIRLMVGLLIPQLNPLIVAEAPKVALTAMRCKYGHAVGKR